MIHIVITSYKEPIATVRAVKSFLNQKVREKFKIIIVDPFPNTEKYLKEHIKDKRVEFFLDPGEGKSYALNLLFQEMSGSKDFGIYANAMDKNGNKIISEEDQLFIKTWLNYLQENNN